MSTALGAAAVMGLLVAVGLLPAWRLVGVRPVTALLAPCVAAVLAGLAAVLAVTVDGDLVRWFVALCVAANAAALGSLAGRRAAPDPGRGRRLRASLGSVGRAGAGVGVLAAAAAWGLRALVRPDVGFDARDIWLEHATWLLSPHRSLVHLLSDPAYAFAHPAYPPLGSAVVALGWQLTGNHSDRLGVVLVSLLGAVVLAAAASVVLELGVVATGGGSGRHARTRRAVLGLVAIAVGAAWVLGVDGLAGAGATDGYVDLLWSAAAVAGAGYALVLPPDARRLRVAAVFCALAALTKDEGAITVALLVVLATVRWWCLRRRDLGPSAAWRAALFGVVGLGGVALWPLATALLHADGDPDRSGPRVGAVGFRAATTWHQLSARLHLAVVALAVSLVATAVFGRWRRRHAVGGDWWLWMLGAGQVLGVGAYYVAGNIDVRLWLAASVDRTMLFPNVLGLAVLAWVALCGTSALLWPQDTGSRGAPHEESLRVLEPAPLSRAR